MTKKNRLGKKMNSALIVFGCVAVSLILGVVAAEIHQTIVCVHLAKTLTVPALKPLTFVLYGSGGDTVSAHFILNNADEQSITQIERSWNGSTLFVDFLSARFADKIFLLPLTIYSDERQNHSGTFLPSYYLNASQCEIFFSSTQSAFERAAFLRLSHYMLNVLHFFSYARLERIVIPLSSCERGIPYAIHTDSQGFITLSLE